MDKIGLKQFETIRTTVTLPAYLVEWSEQFVEKGRVPSRNALIVAALEHFLSELEREEIDRQFAAMADDLDYQALNEQLAGEFADSDREAWLLAEAEEEPVPRLPKE